MEWFFTLDFLRFEKIRELIDDEYFECHFSSKDFQLASNYKNEINTFTDWTQLLRRQSPK